MEDTVLSARIVAEARSWIGTPYRHQGSAKGIACDCLGLVRGVWRAIYGADAEQPPAYTPDWSETTAEETLLKAASRHMERREIDAMQPGDVLVFRWRPFLPARHCGILTEPDRMVHAYQGAGRVAEGWLARQWQAKIAGVFVFPLVSASRAVPPPPAAGPPAGRATMRDARSGLRPMAESPASDQTAADRQTAQLLAPGQLAADRRSPDNSGAPAAGQPRSGYAAVRQK